MADMKIDDATIDTDVTGVELVPASDGGAAKALKVSSIADYALSLLKAAGEVTATTDGSIYLLKDGEIRRIGADALAKAVLDYGFGKAGVAEINGNEVVGVRDAGTQKTVTLDALKTWLAANVTAKAALDFVDVDAAAKPYDGGSYLLLGVGDANKKVSIADFGAWVHGKFAEYVKALTAANAVTSSDTLFIVQGDGAKCCTVAQLMAALGAGDTIAPATTTEDKVPQWSASQKTLKDGLELAKEIAAEPNGTKLATEGAVRTAITAEETRADAKVKEVSDALAKTDEALEAAKKTETDDIAAVREEIAAIDGVSCDDATTQGQIPQWGATQKKLTQGLALVKSVRNTANALDTAVPTEKAVRAMANEFVAGASHNEGAIPVWGAAMELKAGVSLTTVLASSGSDEKVPTEKAVRDALPSLATQAAQGLMSAADKKKLDNLTDTSAVSELGAALEDNDTVVVTKTNGENRKSLLSRIWTYVFQKLPTVALDAFASATDTTNLNVSTAAHGLCPKLDGSSESFLRGDGVFATPSGSEPFTGTDGLADGAKGLVPAPVAADGEKFLSATGKWMTPPSAAGVDIYGATQIENLAADDLAYVFDYDGNVYRKATVAQIRDLALGTKRYDTLFVPAGAMTPANADGATAGSILFTNVTHDTMAFPSSADAKAEFSVVFPDDWDGGVVKAKILWTVYDSTKSEAGQAVGFTLGGISYADGENATVAPTTNVTIADVMDSANELHKTAASAEITIGGTVGGGNLAHFVLTRDADYAPEGGTALPTEALVLGVVIQFGRANSFVQW